MFNTYGVISTYRITSAVTVGAGCSYTHASNANGISDPARYQQISLEQTYNFSARTTLYALEAYQLARGKTLIASGSTTNVTAAVAVVGDSQNTTPSSGPSQFVGMVGPRHAL